MTMLLLLALQQASDLGPLGDRRLLVHVDEGRVEYHGKGRKRSEDRVVVAPLDVDRASRPATWTVTSPDDPAYARGLAPTAVGRKSKGTEFAWYADRWVQGRAVNDRPDHAKEHWIYLELPSPLRGGCSYIVAAGDLLPPLTLRFDDRLARSEAVHVNLLGYPPDAPKFAYLHHWMGDAGGLDVRPFVGRAFRVLEQPGGAVAFSGSVAFRASKDQAETGHLGDSPPHGNFQKADVAECDFTGLTKPGRFVVSVEGVGTSFPFTVAADVYRPAFHSVTRSLYHNRSGIELKKPFTDFERPAPHHPKLTPGFAGRLVYTRSRFPDWLNGDHDAKDRPAIEKGVAGPLDAWGWYQDAGDWDGYWSHLNVSSQLLLAWELAPANFGDGELNLPESGNGLPDILDEAAWLPRFCLRLRAELVRRGYGSGGLGLRVCGDHFGGDGEGVPSYLDVHRQWIASGEDPWSTYRYAAVAAQLARALRTAGLKDPEGADWTVEAVESYRWAAANTRPEDEGKKTGVDGLLREVRAYAAAALFRLTGEAAYQKRMAEDLGTELRLSDMSRWAAWLHALGGGPGAYDADLVARARKAALQAADVRLDAASKRALRWGGDWWFPMLVGQQTTPMITELMVAHALLRDVEPQKAKAVRAAALTTADYFLGTNALNTTWVTGLGPRHPAQVFHLDAFYNGKGGPHPGVIPYGPWRKDAEAGAGPWDKAWAHKTAYPAIDAWPGAERWFDNRCSPMTSEFTVHQNAAVAAALFGWLCAPAK